MHSCIIESSANKYGGLTGWKSSFCRTVLLWTVNPHTAYSFGIRDARLLRMLWTNKIDVRGRIMLKIERYGILLLSFASQIDESRYSCAQAWLNKTKIIYKVIFDVMPMPMPTGKVKGVRITFQSIFDKRFDFNMVVLQASCMFISFI